MSENSDERREEHVRRSLRVEYDLVLGDESDSPTEVLRELIRQEMRASSDSATTARQCSSPVCREIFGRVIQITSSVRTACPFCGMSVNDVTVPLDSKAMEASSPDGLVRVRGRYERGEAVSQWRIAVFYFTVCRLRLHAPLSFQQWLIESGAPSYVHVRNLILVVEEGFREPDFVEFGQSNLIALARASLSRPERAGLLLEIGAKRLSTRDVERRATEIRAARMLEANHVPVRELAPDAEQNADRAIPESVDLPRAVDGPSQLVSEVTVTVTIPVDGVVLFARSDRVDGHLTDSPVVLEDDYFDMPAGELYAVRLVPYRVRGKWVGMRALPVEYETEDEAFDHVVESLDPAENDP